MKNNIDEKLREILRKLYWRFKDMNSVLQVADNEKQFIDQAISTIKSLTKKVESKEIIVGITIQPNGSIEATSIPKNVILQVMDLRKRGKK